MTHRQDTLILMASIPALDLAKLRRRVRFLEAVLVQVLREQSRIKEWFSADELVKLRLPGLPTVAASITRLARAQGWMASEVPCKGGKRRLYHFSSLPERAFQSLIDRVIRHPPPPDAAGPVPWLPPAPASIAATILAANTEPPWLLPLMRIIKGGAPTVADALKKLPAAMPHNVPCPSEGEARQVLQRLGLSG